MTAPNSTAARLRAFFVDNLHGSITPYSQVLLHLSLIHPTSRRITMMFPAVHSQ